MTTRRGNREGTTPVKRDDGRWQSRVAWTDETGKPHRVSVYGKTPAEARRKAKEIIRRLDAGQPGRDAKHGLSEFVETWIGSSLAASDRKASTKATYATLARNHIVGSPLGRMSLDKIKPSTVEGWIVGLRAKGLSESTVRQVYTVLRSILATAQRDGLVATNAAAAVPRPRVAREEAEYLTSEQVRSLLAHASDSRYALLFALLVHTGLRRGEALALRWRDVDLEGRRLHVRGTLSRHDGELSVSTPKTTKSRRVVPLSETAAEILREIKARTKYERQAAANKWVSTEFVFVTEFGEPADPRNALRALTVAARRAGLPKGVGLHTLRHTAASLMLSNGVPMPTVSAILGHTSIAVTVDLYGHVAPDVSLAAIDRLSAALEG